MYCSKCGQEISESATFCSNCGNRVNKVSKGYNAKEYIESLDFKRALKAVKEYFTNFYVDYNSMFFKFAMLLLLTTGIGYPTYNIVLILFSSKTFDLFPGAVTLFKFLICLLLLAVFAIPILKQKTKTNIKKSNVLVILWIVFNVLNILTFFVPLYKYVLFPGYAYAIVKILSVASSACFIHKNRPKTPAVLIVSALSFALSLSSSWNFIKLYIDWYRIFKTSSHFFDVLSSLRYIILVAILFLLVYIIPRKVSKWLVFIPALIAATHMFIEMIDDFYFTDIPNFIMNLSIVLLFVLFALSCSRKKYDYIIDNKGNRRKNAVIISVVSTSSLAIIIVSYLLVSAIVCSSQINRGIEKWRRQIVGANLTNSQQWREMNGDIFKYNCTGLASQFIDDYSLYQKLQDNRYTMEKISLCYSSYNSGRVDEEVLDTYSYIHISDDWKYDDVLSVYYNKYMQMKPNIEKVSVSGYIDVSKRKIEITVTNKNIMPISKCKINCTFTLLFVKSGTYSSAEYGRGSKTIVINDIDGDSEKSESVSFNPDDYFDSYGSYITAIVTEKRVTIDSIE